MGPRVKKRILGVGELYGANLGKSYDLSIINGLTSTPPHVRVPRIRGTNNRICVTTFACHRPTVLTTFNRSDGGSIIATQLRSVLRRYIDDLLAMRFARCAG